MKTLQNLIGGTWEDSRGDAFHDVVNPATEEVVARCPSGSPQDVRLAVDAAVRAQPAWAALSVAERVERLSRWADTVAAHADELAELECREMGKPVALGRAFIGGAATGFKAAVAEALEYAFEETIDGTGTTIVRTPLGVAAVIVPWNFPVPMTLGALGPLLAAGNTVVLKPSERSPMSAVRLLELMDLPPGVVNLVLGDSRAGAPLVADERVGLVHFTGSVESGRKVGERTGALLRRSILELGGKDPVVVDAGVDPVATAAAVAFGAFANSGQICTSMERVYVHRDVAEPFIEALVEAAGTYALGDGHDAGTVLGPLVDRRQRDIVARHVADAVARGATVRAGGVVPEGRGFFYPATVLTGVEESMLVMTEETFGPIAPVVVVSSFEEGLERASASRFGLAATVYTADPAHMAAARRIPAGVVWVNQWQGGGPERLYEPAGDSGMGATGSRAAYDAATRPTSIHTAPAA
ncbi:aldehyde dehydrogenase family protein [Nonomuraea angiospora]|uniref:Acyl-CoA reductase-like NAD-dependent aldehyde dehydrogenase n=1 Tax=Nonomuraea angiospora TaxID=46172 RepID=A0ABR9LPF3_9ACTN|nr:aldehyde dehydrogenase family protein [Nonomuraea angiospora]MBE1582482.1 acyl-CoA reductase-like NAD-dependent aldehyde dehydrogenase [Nonomuraea angiospora]